MSTVRKKRLFIGSSTIHIKLAHALCENFEHSDLEAHVWDVSKWGTTDTSLASLIDFLDTYQFGAFILSPDDSVRSPATLLSAPTKDAPRDNVIFEFGLWVGRAGKDRTWFVHPSNREIKIPTDLKGIAGAVYKYPVNYENQTVMGLKPIMAHAHNQIEDGIRDFQKKASNDDYYRAHAKRIDILLKEAPDDEERIKVVTRGLGDLLRERAAHEGHISDALHDLMLWSQSLLDALDFDDIAEEQAKLTKAVWVFAPVPWETLNHPELRHFRNAVRKNVFNRKIPYTYFVRNEADVKRIQGLFETFISESDEKLTKKELNGLVKLVFIPAELFLAYFTIHVGQSSHIIYQSVVRDQRVSDFIIRVDDGRAAEINDIITALRKSRKSMPLFGNGKDVLTSTPKSHTLSSKSGKGAPKRKS